MFDVAHQPTGSSPQKTLVCTNPTEKYIYLQSFVYTLNIIIDVRNVQQRFLSIC